MLWREWNSIKIVITSGFCGTKNVESRVDVGGGSISGFVPIVSTNPRSCFTPQ